MHVHKKERDGETDRKKQAYRIKQQARGERKHVGRQTRAEDKASGRPSHTFAGNITSGNKWPLNAEMFFGDFSILKATVLPFFILVIPLFLSLFITYIWMHGRTIYFQSAAGRQREMELNPQNKRKSRSESYISRRVGWTPEYWKHAANPRRARPARCVDGCIVFRVK